MRDGQTIRASEPARWLVWADLSGVVQGERPAGKSPASAYNTISLAEQESFDPIMRLPQLVRCTWTGDMLLFRYLGACLTCGRNTFDEASGRTDPRGMIGDSSAVVFEGDEEEMHPGAQVVLCFPCGNDEGCYGLAVDELRRLSELLRRREDGLA